MADYDWFEKDYTRQQDSDAKVYGDTADFDVKDRDSNTIGMRLPMDAKNKDVQATADEVVCNYCQCLINPYVWAMRQHRKVCSIDPRIAGTDDDSAGVL